MERLRSRSAAKTVAPLRIATRTSGVSVPAYTSEISRPSLRTRFAMRSAEIIARPGARRELRALGLIATPSGMQGESSFRPRLRGLGRLRTDGEGGVGVGLGWASRVAWRRAVRESWGGDWVAWRALG